MLRGSGGIERVGPLSCGSVGHVMISFDGVFGGGGEDRGRYYTECSQWTSIGTEGCLICNRSSTAVGSKASRREEARTTSAATSPPGNNREATCPPGGKAAKVSAPTGLTEIARLASKGSTVAHSRKADPWPTPPEAMIPQKVRRGSLVNKHVDTESNVAPSDSPSHSSPWYVHANPPTPHVPTPRPRTGRARDCRAPHRGRDSKTSTCKPKPERLPASLPPATPHQRHHLKQDKSPDPNTGTASAPGLSQAAPRRSDYTGENVRRTIREPRPDSTATTDRGVSPAQRGKQGRRREEEGKLTYLASPTPTKPQKLPFFMLHHSLSALPPPRDAASGELMVRRARYCARARRSISSSSRRISASSRALRSWRRLLRTSWARLALERGAVPALGPGPSDAGWARVGLAGSWWWARSRRE